VTSTTDTARHPDVSEISELTEGLLSPSRTADVRHHLDICSLCADVRDSLAEIRGVLGTLPGPPRMPADVAGRIDAALAAEALIQATTPDKTVVVSRETTTSLKPSGPSASPERGMVDASCTDRPAGHPRTATGPQTTGPGRRNGPTSRRRHKAILGAVLCTAAVGVTVLFLQFPSFTAPEETAQKAADTNSSSEGSQDFTASLLQRRVTALLAADPSAKNTSVNQPGSAQPHSDSGALTSVPEPFFRPEPQVPGCIQRSTGSTDPVLALEKGTYQGQQAYLLVLSLPDDGSRVQAYVIDAQCVDSAPSATGKVLLTHTYPRR
jgi:hypothetical protein